MIEFEAAEFLNRFILSLDHWSFAPRFREMMMYEWGMLSVGDRHFLNCYLGIYPECYSGPR